MSSAVISICYKKKRSRASCKAINNLFFLYINLYENNITYVLRFKFIVPHIADF